MKLVVQIKPTAEIVKRLGLNPGGKVQKFWTQRCAACISKYLPFRAANSFGAALDRGISPDGTKITLDLPYARFLYYGKLMVGEKTGSAYARSDEKKVVAVPEKDLIYTTTHNQQAGPYWDRRMIQNDMPGLEKELEEFVKGKHNG